MTNKGRKRDRENKRKEERYGKLWKEERYGE